MNFARHSTSQAICRLVRSSEGRLTASARSGSQPLASRQQRQLFSKSVPWRDASQPAPSSSSSSSSSSSELSPHEARLAAAAAANASPKKTADTIRSRLTALQNERMQDLRRRAGGKGPQQRWSNRTLIALATCVGACTFLTGTYHGYNAGKKHAFEQVALGEIDPTTAKPFPKPQAESRTANLTDSSSQQQIKFPVSPPQQPPSGNIRLPVEPSPKAESSFRLAQLLPSLFGLLTPSSLHCEEEPPTPRRSRTECRLAELVQYHCELQGENIVCQPLDRIFRLCPGRPAVEVTHIVEFDQQGNPYLPDHLREAMPPSQHWHEMRAPDL